MSQQVDKFQWNWEINTSGLCIAMVYVDKLKVKGYQYLATYSSERLERNYIIMSNKLSLFIKKDSVIISVVQLSEKYDYPILTRLIETL